MIDTFFTSIFSIFSMLPFEWAQFQFMFLATLAILMIAPLLALVGTLASDHHMTFFSDSIGHASITGLAAGILLGLSAPLWTIVAYGQIIALLLFVIKKYSNVKVDALIGIVANFSVALGIVLLSYSSSLNKLSGLLLGSLLTINEADIKLLALFVFLFLPVFLYFYKSFQIVNLSRSLAKSRGLNADLLEYMIFALIALIVSMSIQWIGVLVLNAMLIFPAAIAKSFCHGMRRYVIYSVIIGLFTSLAGLIISYYVGSSSGATIVLLQVICFMLSLLYRKI